MDGGMVASRSAGSSSNTPCCSRIPWTEEPQAKKLEDAMTPSSSATAATWTGPEIVLSPSRDEEEQRRSRVARLCCSPRRSRCASRSLRSSRRCRRTNLTGEQRPERG